MIKRERNLNFSREETDMLVSLVEKNKHIIENKKSDAVTWKEKEEKWKAIESAFNSSGIGVFRSAKHLRTKYEALKRSTRKKASSIRAELYKTGGGVNEAPPLTAVEQKLKQMIILSVEGVKVFTTPIIWCDIYFLAINIEDAQKDVCAPVPSTSQMDRESPVPATSPIDLNGSPVHASHVDITITPEPSTSTGALDIGETPNKKWAKWKSSNLKSKKHPALCKPKEKKPFDRLVEAKLELVELQKKIIKEELEEKILKTLLIKKEIEQKKELFELEKEERFLKIEILNHELDSKKIK
ncbi:uncharacterized protein [Choristoneura fumiferana]|uniref:uncharacterized protein n=1 Tax=Choristoneura fumiferana TaxID=7141 RepID=UPI003D159FC2